MIRLIPTVLLVALTLPAFAADYMSPRSAALGGAGHAGPLSNDSIYQNPSYASFLRTYSVAGGYQTYGGEESSGRIMNVSVVDGRSPLFQAGLGYTVLPNGSWVHLGASKAFIQRLSFGLGGKLLLENGTPKTKEANVSGTFILANWAQASLIVDNLIQDVKSLERNLYREIVLGTKILLGGILVAYIDPHWTPEIEIGKFGIEAGGEFTVFKDLFLRAGFFTNSNAPYSELRGRGWGGGIGWISQRLSLDYAYHRVLEATTPSPGAFAHTFGTTIYF